MISNYWIEFEIFVALQRISERLRDVSGVVGDLIMGVLPDIVRSIVAHPGNEVNIPRFNIVGDVIKHVFHGMIWGIAVVVTPIACWFGTGVFIFD